MRDRVEVYDGTLYFSDIWFRDRGVRAVVEEAEEAVRSGYLGLKFKVGRGSRLYFAEKALPAPLAVLTGGLMRLRFMRWARRTTAEVLAEITPNERLRAVLTGQFGDYGLPPGQTTPSFSEATGPAKDRKCHRPVELEDEAVLPGALAGDIAADPVTPENAP